MLYQAELHPEKGRFFSHLRLGLHRRYISGRSGTPEHFHANPLAPS